MRKKHQIKVVDQASLWLHSPQEADTIKFDLYVKYREIEQISDSLKKLLLLPADQRDHWLDENESMVAELMDSFMDDSVLVMDGLQLDQESMDLSVKLVTEMRNAMDMIHRIFAAADSASS